jgi:antitoxin HicB
MTQTAQEATKYTALIRPSEHEGEVTFEAVLKEFGSSLTAFGRTPAEALKRLYREGDDLIELLRDSGKSVPEPQLPQPWEGHSGKMTVRMPRSLHYKLQMLAEEENVSLNTLVVTILAWGAEHKHCQVRPFVPNVVDNRQLTVNINALPRSPNQLSWGAPKLTVVQSTGS